jgi:aspartate racemase
MRLTVRASTARHTLGILGGMGPASTVDFYAKLVAATPAASDQDHVKTIIWSDPTIPDRTAAIVDDGPDPTPQLIEGARHLGALGSDVIAMPCNTAHAFLPEIQRSVSIPIVSLIESAAIAVRDARPRARRIGLIATTGTIRSRLYEIEAAKMGVDLVTPTEIGQATVMRAIRSIKAGQSGDAVATPLTEIAGQLVARGAEILIAGCSEVLLALPAADVDAEVIDPAQALVERLLRMMGIEPRSARVAAATTLYDPLVASDHPK